jgi:hypothetical protein
MKDETRPHISLPRRLLADARARFEPSDALVYFYALVFVRQYLWVIENNWLAWSLAVPLTAALWVFYVSTKPLGAERVGREFWLLVCLPLLLIYALRAPFPDLSFDVLNYRLLHAERSLRGALFAPGDFFPTPAPYNPAPDTLTGLFRLALGYRLGTIVNLFALVWAGHVLDKILRPFVARAWARSACVLLALLAEHVLLEVNTYMVDLLALPLLLEATYLALREDEQNERNERRALYVHAALLLGLSAALKLTNATAIAPLVVFFAYRGLVGKRRLAPLELARTSVLALAAFVAPLLPFAVYLWRLTGNPFLPLANGYFKSPYWPTNGGWDSRWGPFGFWETLGWPVLSALEPARHSELAVYSGRLALGFVVALAGLAFTWRDARARLLCVLLILGCLLWSAGGMGYSRYGLYLELLAGAVVVAVASILARATSRATPRWTKMVASLVLVALAAQAALACYYFLGHGWGVRATAISEWRSYAYESRFFLRDRSLGSFLPETERALVSNVHAWIESGIKSNGIEAMLNADAPIIAVNHWEYFDTRDSKSHFARAVESAPGAKMFSLCFPEDLARARADVERRGLVVGTVTPVQIPFFSSRHRIGMMLVEVPQPREAEARARLETYVEQSPLAASGYRAEITALGAPTTMHVGERVTLTFRVRNIGGSVWPARGDAKGWYQVNLADRWLDAGEGKVLNALDARTSLRADLPPGGEVEMPLAVNAPREPGEYVLEIDMVHEGITFFNEKGSKSLRLPVRVEP